MAILAALLAGLLFAAPASAAITFTLGTGNPGTNTQKLLIDSNSCTTAGPKSAFVGGRITNTGTSAVTGITATMAGLTSNIYFAGGQTSSQSLGALGAGESVGVYWFVGYNCVEGATATPTISLSSSLGLQSSTVNLQIYKAISSNAGGLVTSTVLDPGAVVGQIVDITVSYSFGGTSAGDEFYLQPAGNQSFNAACFRLVGSKIDPTPAGATQAAAIPVGAASNNKLYFLATSSQGGTGRVAVVRYSFQYLCANQATSADPYAAQTSGASNLKYTGNFGTTPIAYPVGSNPFTITKSVSPGSAVIGGGTTTLTYTVTVSNPSGFATYVDRIDDQLPAGITFSAIGAGSAVTAANSSSIPATGASGAISFRGKVGSSYALAAGSSVVLIYTATAPTAAGTYVNTAQAAIGSALTGTASATFTLTPPVNAVAETATVTAGSAAVAIANVRANDSINGALATAANSVIAVVGTWPAGIALNTSTGAITVAAAVAPGTYSITYQLCNLATPTPACASVADTITVVAPSVDLRITKTNGVTAVRSGSATTYTVTVTNSGPDAAVGAIVTDVVGAGLTCAGANPVTITGSGVPAGSFTITNLIGAGITLGPLATGQSAILTYSCGVN